MTALIGVEEVHINRDDIFEFLVSFKRVNGGNSPSLRQICEGCGIASVSTAHYALRDLEAAGRIMIDTKIGGRPFIRIIGEHWEYEGEEVEESQL